MRSRACVVAIAAAIVAAAPARGQDTTSRGLNAAAPANLALGPGSGSPNAELLLEATKDATTGTGAFGWATGSQQFRLALSGPLNGQATEPLSLTGLAAGAKAQLSWNYIYKKVASLDEQERRREMCAPILDAKQRAVADADRKEAAARRAEIRAAVAPVSERTAAEHEAIELAAQARAARAAVTDVRCVSSDFSGLEAARFDELAHLHAPGFLFGLDGSANNATFAYVDEDLADKQDDRQGGAFTVRGGVLSPSGTNVFVSHTFTRTHKAASDPTSLCSPRPSTTSLECRDVVIGAPVRVERSVTSIELRRFFTHTVAMSPVFLYDWKKDVFAVDVPFYFIGGGNNASGGVRIGWRSDTESLSAVVFIGASLGLIPN